MNDQATAPPDFQGASTPIDLAVLDQMDRADREAVMRELQRTIRMEKIAKLRWWIATKHHRLPDGTKPNFERWPFQRELYQSQATDLRIIGSAGFGKTMWAICDDAAKAFYGLRVLHVVENETKQKTFVNKDVDPVFNNVPWYKSAIQAAKQRAAEANNVEVKCLGEGSISFVPASSESPFVGSRYDSALVDDHHICNPRNIQMIPDRLTGSDYGYTVYIGNPRSVGTEENQNIDWEYKRGDMRAWKIPCRHCGQEQELTWFGHFIKQRTNKMGVVTEFKLRDEERAGSEGLDHAFEPRPVCQNCHRTMDRLSADGRWVAHQPGRQLTSYRLSSLVNPSISMWKLVQQYRGAMRDPQKMSLFIWNQLGLAYNVDGTSISESMLAMCASGEEAGIPAYQLIQATALRWR